jgi:hypothetical protein
MPFGITFLFWVLKISGQGKITEKISPKCLRQGSWQNLTESDFKHGYWFFDGKIRKKMSGILSLYGYDINPEMPSGLLQSPGM